MIVEPTNVSGVIDNRFYAQNRWTKTAIVIGKILRKKILPSEMLSNIYLFMSCLSKPVYLKSRNTLLLPNRIKKQIIQNGDKTGKFDFYNPLFLLLPWRIIPRKCLILLSFAKICKLYANDLQM